MTKQTIFTAIIALSAFTSFAQKEHHKVLAIGFYNCENFFDTIDDPAKDDIENTPSPEVFAQKLHNIATVFQKLGTDVTPDGPAIIGIAEVENDNVLKAVVAQPEIKNRNYQYIWFPTPDVRGISTAMLYNPKYFKLLSSRPIHVPLEELGQSRPTRDVLYVCGILAGDTVHLLVNHWPSKIGWRGKKCTRPQIGCTSRQKTD